MSNSTIKDQPFLPDFGSLGVAIRIIFLAELMAIIITVSRNSVFNEQAWADFNLLSAFALTISFCSIVVLKLASPFLRRMSVVGGSLAVFLLLLAVAMVGTEFIIFALYDIGLIDQRWPEWRNSLVIRSVIIVGLISIPALRYMFLAYRIQADQKIKQDAKMQTLLTLDDRHFQFHVIIVAFLK